MKPGETFVGYDPGNHLWVVLSFVTGRGEIALVNLTTHKRSRGCGEHCVTVSPGEHPFVRHESCIYYRGVRIRPERSLSADTERGWLRPREPVGEDLLRRIQEGALASQFPSKPFKDAIRETLRRGP